MSSVDYFPHISLIAWIDFPPITLLSGLTWKIGCLLSTYDLIRVNFPHMTILKRHAWKMAVLIFPVHLACMQAAANGES